MEFVPTIRFKPTLLDPVNTVSPYLFLISSKFCMFSSYWYVAHASFGSCSIFQATLLLSSSRSFLCSCFLTYGSFYLLTALIFTVCLWIFIFRFTWNYTLDLSCLIKKFTWDFHILTPAGKICHWDFMYLDLNCFC